jgi:hypothetical protein
LDVTDVLVAAEAHSVDPVVFVSVSARSCVERRHAAEVTRVAGLRRHDEPRAA